MSVPTAFPFAVTGQSGALPSCGFGTATLFDDACATAVHEAIRVGVRAIDTALLYNNQEAVGRGIRAAIAEGLVSRSDLFVTTKVAFFPASHDGKNAWFPIKWHPENVKGEAATAAGVDLCLQLLGLDYVDLLLIHNPCTSLEDYTASSLPHEFELAGSRFDSEERKLVLAHRFAAVNVDLVAAEADRAASWRALEAALASGKAKYIGVSNYPAELIRSMASYAKVMPAVNQLELHPRFAHPGLRAYAASAGMVLTAYGSGNSTQFSKSAVVARIAAERGCSPIAVVLRWTLQKGVAVIPRSASPAHMAANLAVAASPPLTSSQVAEIDALNENWPYYWHPAPLFPRGTYTPDL